MLWLSRSTSFLSSKSDKVCHVTFYLHPHETRGISAKLRKTRNDNLVVFSGWGGGGSKDQVCNKFVKREEKINKNLSPTVASGG